MPTGLLLLLLAGICWGWWWLRRAEAEAQAARPGPALEAPPRRGRELLELARRSAGLARGAVRPDLVGPARRALAATRAAAADLEARRRALGLAPALPSDWQEGLSRVARSLESRSRDGNAEPD